MTIASPVRLTYDDYCQIPNDGKRHELIDGEHIMTPSPIDKHQVALGNLYVLIRTFVRTRELGRVFLAPFDVILSKYSVVEPDLLFVRASRVKRIVKKWVFGAPDLVVEILSPTTSKIDRGMKKRLYERHKVQEYWIVDPDEQTVEVYALQENRYKLFSRARTGQNVKSQVLSGFECEVKSVFQIN